MKRNGFKIYKSNGNIERYSRSKLYSSLRRSGLSNREASLITSKVGKEISEGSKTRDIYHKTLKLVNEQSRVAAVQYSLKRSIFELGPTGHNFEKFVARYFQELGFTTKTCLTFNGKWVKHEVDVVVEKSGARYFVECKFHNRIGIKNDIKVALYVKARWDDLKEGPEGKNLSGFYLASNTAFSLDAITYAEGSGLWLLGVNAPQKESFLEQIKNMKLYPVTSLKRLNRHTKNFLISQNLLLARDIPANLNLLFRLGLDETQINSILDEVNLLTGAMK